VDEVVRASWNRCINTYSLDPQETKRPTVVERADLQARCERLGVVLPIARIEMEALGKLMEHSEYSVMLTDRDGVILSYVGDPGFAATARRCGFREGVLWSEREMGTNGMGTCLTTQRSVVIHRTDHFLDQNTKLTCSAAPIFDMRGQLIAALDISGASEHTQTHTLALVDMAAQNVENRAFLGASKDFHVLRFHRCAEFVSTPGEGVLAFDDQGTIRGANRGALKLLGVREHEALCGQRVDRVLDTGLGALMQLSSRPGFRPEALMVRHRARAGRVGPPDSLVEWRDRGSCRRQHRGRESRGAELPGLGRPGDAAECRNPAARGRPRHLGAAAWGNRYRQGLLCARHSCRQPPRRQAIRRGQLRRDTGNADRELTVRAQGGCLHRCHARGQYGPHSAGQRRHAVPG
jgi:PAS domain-containing protein